MKPKQLLIVVNDARFFWTHRLPVALAAAQAGYKVHVATPDSPYADKIRRAGLIYHEVIFNRGRDAILGELRSIARLNSVIGRVKPDVVHLVTIKAVLYGGMLARIRGIPCVAAVPGLGTVFTSHGVKAAVRRAIVKVLYRFAFGNKKLAVIFQNSSDRDALLTATGLKPGATLLIPGSGVDLELFSANPPPAGEPVVLMAARMLREKGVFDFVAAARAAKERGIKARFQLAGDPDPGNPTSIAPSELQSWRDKGDLEVLGHRDDIPELLQAASIVVLPSYYGEGLPKILIEAAAAARPVITTDMPGCRDAVEPGESALLIPSKDPDALLRAVEKLAGDRELREKMGRRGRELAEARFSSAEVCKAHLKVYDALSGE